MITKYDMTTLDRDSLPEEVLHEIHEYEDGFGRELVSIKRYDIDDEVNEKTFELVFFEAFFDFEPSPYDSFSFVRVCYQKWPTDAVHTYYYSSSRGDMQEALKYESKKQKEDVA
jgi:hypothetical protein